MGGARRLGPARSCLKPPMEHQKSAVVPTWSSVDSDNRQFEAYAIEEATARKNGAGTMPIALVSAGPTKTFEDVVYQNNMRTLCQWQLREANARGRGSRIPTTFKRRVASEDACQWRTFDERVDISTVALDGSTRMSRIHFNRGFPVVMEGPADVWPDKSCIPRRFQERMQEVSTCVLSDTLPCIKYLVASTLPIGNLECKRNGSRRLASATDFAVIKKEMTSYLFQFMNTGSMRQSPLAVGTRAVDTYVESSEPPTVLPTAQAERQKEQKKKNKQSLLDKGYSEEDVKRMTRRKPQEQENVHDDCGSDDDD